jgi:hypothetical protein
LELIILPGGAMRCIYGDLLPLVELGRVSIERASHVEPDVQNLWHADLTPVGGPRLGPFERREQALAAEVAWLQTHWLV